jgi:curved DNA-binding protein CbpA
MSTAKVTVDSYAILGLARDASVKDINVAYKRLALKLHPDKAGNDDAAIERFQKVFLQHSLLTLPDSMCHA